MLQESQVLIHICLALEKVTLYAFNVYKDQMTLMESNLKAYRHDKTCLTVTDGGINFDVFEKDGACTCSCVVGRTSGIPCAHVLCANAFLDKPMFDTKWFCRFYHFDRIRKAVSKAFEFFEARQQFFGMFTCVFLRHDRWFFHSSSGFPEKPSAYR